MISMTNVSFRRKSLRPPKLPQEQAARFEAKKYLTDASEVASALGKLVGIPSLVFGAWVAIRPAPEIVAPSYEVSSPFGSVFVVQNTSKVLTMNDIEVDCQVLVSETEEPTLDHMASSKLDFPIIPPQRFGHFTCAPPSELSFQPELVIYLVRAKYKVLGLSFEDTLQTFYWRKGAHHWVVGQRGLQQK
jgi:hypothetical protein